MVYMWGDVYVYVCVKGNVKISLNRRGTHGSSSWDRVRRRDHSTRKATWINMLFFFPIQPVYIIHSSHPSPEVIPSHPPNHPDSSLACSVRLLRVTIQKKPTQYLVILTELGHVGRVDR